MEFLKKEREKEKKVKEKKEKKIRDVDKKNIDEIKKYVGEVMFCKECGALNKVEGVNECVVCRGKDFIDGDVAKKINEYYGMMKRALLKKYAKSEGFDIKGMDSGEVMWKLLCRDGIYNEGDLMGYEFIEKVVWKRF